MDIIIYQPFVNEIKELIQRKQFQAIKMVNTETINLYWKIGEEIYRQQREKGWGKSIVQILRRNCKRSSQERRDIQQQTCGECVIFI